METAQLKQPSSSSQEETEIVDIESNPINREEVGDSEAQERYEASLEGAVRVVGHEGNYQKMVQTLAVLGLFGCAFLTYNLSFTASEPVFLCPVKDGSLNFQPCGEELACKTKGAQTLFKFHSWSKQKNLVCNAHHIRENGKFIALLTNSIVCFLSLNLADVIGRKFTVLLNSAIILLSLLFAYIFSSYYLKMFFIGMAYGCEGTFSSIFTFIMNEVTSRLFG